MLGLKPRTAQLFLQKIRAFFGKPKRDLVTVYEFCQYMNWREDKVMEYLK